MILSSFKQKVRNIDQEFYVSIELLFLGYQLFVFIFSIPAFKLVINFHVINQK